ncbi:MAG TPA: hypothetical protein VHN15_09445 [Thermoanaerobaculia bacterium]|nr:hypothetical protein [Thermoanaerobaculia bacterium]
MKNTKKLALNRETIQGLEKNVLQQVRGGLVEQQRNPAMIITCFCPDC